MDPAAAAAAPTTTTRAAGGGGGPAGSNAGDATAAAAVGCRQFPEPESVFVNGGRRGWITSMDLSPCQGVLLVSSTNGDWGEVRAWDARSWEPLPAELVQPDLAALTRNAGEAEPAEPAAVPAPTAAVRYRGWAWYFDDLVRLVRWSTKGTHFVVCLEASAVVCRVPAAVSSPVATNTEQAAPVLLAPQGGRERLAKYMFAACFVHAPLASGTSPDPEPGADLGGATHAPVGGSGGGGGGGGGNGGEGEGDACGGGTGSPQEYVVTAGKDVERGKDRSSWVRLWTGWRGEGRGKPRILANFVGHVARVMAVCPLTGGNPGECFATVSLDNSLRVWGLDAVREDDAAVAGGVGDLPNHRASFIKHLPKQQPTGKHTWKTSLAFHPGGSGGGGDNGGDDAADPFLVVGDRGLDATAQPGAMWILRGVTAMQEPQRCTVRDGPVVAVAVGARGRLVASLACGRPDVGVTARDAVVHVHRSVDGAEATGSAALRLTGPTARPPQVRHGAVAFLPGRATPPIGGGGGDAHAAAAVVVAAGWGHTLYFWTLPAAVVVAADSSGAAGPAAAGRRGAGTVDQHGGGGGAAAVQAQPCAAGESGETEEVGSCAGAGAAATATTWRGGGGGGGGCSGRGDGGGAGSRGLGGGGSKG